MPGWSNGHVCTESSATLETEVIGEAADHRRDAVGDSRRSCIRSLLRLRIRTPAGPQPFPRYARSTFSSIKGTSTAPNLYL